MAAKASKKSFKKFILDASYDAGQPVSADKKKLIRGFYKIVSKKKYDNSEIVEYLDGHDYQITTQELRKIRNLHVATDYFFEVHNRDY
ncbi:MAG: hypothetical protein JRJ09_08620 [Deltaproteobacteria bacterium]|nr:hypothetical protein [Deltaproteobacteria bacterium]MBW2110614.1 hypothetical protein [Deltaproteobacteria bacterium]HDZ90060.1 hypothetical protein [Deltaproteobacteria bacterium]